MDTWPEYIERQMAREKAHIEDEARRKRKVLRANHAVQKQERRVKLVTFQLELEAYAAVCNTPLTELVVFPSACKVRDLYKRLIMLGVSKAVLLKYADQWGLRALFVERSL